jgi:hypothetical protein
MTEQATAAKRRLRRRCGGVNTEQRGGDRAKSELGGGLLLDLTERQAEQRRRARI